MKAPDKIFLNRKHPEPYWFKDKQVDSDIEYIRKDALLELIKEESKFWDDGEMIFRALIDKIDSMKREDDRIERRLPVPPDKWETPLG